MADLFELDWCMGKGCQHQCCSHAATMHAQLCTPPRPFALSASPLRQCLPSAFKRLVFYDDDDNGGGGENDGCPLQQSTFSSPSTSDTEDDDDDKHENSNSSIDDPVPLFSPVRQPFFSLDLEHLGEDDDDENDRAVTPANALARLETFIDFAEQLRAELRRVHRNQPKPEHALLLLHEKFGGKDKAVLSPRSRLLLTKASLTAKQTMKQWSKKQFEASFEGSNKFHCKPCNSVETRFKTREGAMLHYRNIHDDFKPYPCQADEQCEHKFARRTDLRLHLIRKHEPNRPFTCKAPRCNKGFASSCEMKRHLTTDHKDLLKALCGTGEISKALFAPKQHPKKPAGKPASKRVKCEEE